MFALAPTILTLALLASPGKESIRLKGRTIYFSTNDREIQLATPKLDPNQETGYLVEPFAEGSTATSFYLWQVSNHPTLTDENGRYYSLTIYYAEYGKDDRSEQVRRVGNFGFWGTRKKVGDMLEFEVHKIKGTTTSKGVHSFSFKVFPGFPSP